MENVLYGGHSNNCCAYCKLHKVSMTVKQMKNKDCLKKQCWHLEKNGSHPIWHQRECLKQKKKARKAIKI